MIDIIKYFNEEYLYETILTVSIVIIILYALYSYITGKKGTW